jgi:PIN domain nuclease of toxin-antitoxin system
MAENTYLLDTHSLIWFQENNPKIPNEILDIIQNLDNTIFFSQISLFELAIKLRIGKIPDSVVSVEDIHLQALKDGFTYLDIQNKHIYRYDKVPLFENHRDPFDRLLIATAMEEQAIILSADDKFKLYEGHVKILW